ncbi:MAG: cyclic nucleotide-binding domain-containing protein [Gemmatimonadota bacterium]
MTEQQAPPPGVGRLWRPQRGLLHYPDRLLAGFLRLRPGEGRLLGILGAFLFLSMATGTTAMAAANGLFLSTYPAHLIPYAVIAAALVTAAVAIIFAGMIAGTARRTFAVKLTLFLVASLLLGRAAVMANPRASFLLYLWLSTLQVLVLTHAWDYVGDLLTGRQAKRLMPLIGIGASLGALIGGILVAPAALRLGTRNLLLVGGALLLASLPLLWMVPEPGTAATDGGRGDDAGPESGAPAAMDFFGGVRRGVEGILHRPLIRILALGVVFLSFTSVLVSLQFQLALQETFREDQIAAVFGMVTAAIGLGTLVVQVLSSRVIFPRMGVSFAAASHAALLSVAAAGAAVFGGFAARALLQIVEDTLQNALQKPVEQISLVPFTGPLKNAVAVTLGGILRPLSQAAGGGLAIILLARGNWLAVATTIFAVLAFLSALRHRRVYLAALEEALARHTAEFTSLGPVPLMVDRESLAVLDRGLADPDPSVVIFSLSLLPQLPPEDAVPRALALLRHSAPEVRAQAAGVLARVDADDPEEIAQLLFSRAMEETSPLVIAALLEAIAELAPPDEAELRPFLEADDIRVRRKGLVALGRKDRDATTARLRELMRSDDREDRLAAAGAAGDLAIPELAGELTALVEDDAVRPVALESLVRIGEASVPVMGGLLARRALPLPIRRSVVTALAAIPSATAQSTLLNLVSEPALGPPALTSLRRLRADGSLPPVPAERLRSLLENEVRQGFRYALIARALREREEEPRPLLAFVADELAGLRMRALHRALRILALSYDNSRIEAARTGLLSDDPGIRSNALELLEGIVSREDASIVIPFAEAGPEEFDLEAAAPFLGDVERLLSHPLEGLLEDPDWWPRALGLHALGRGGEITIPGRNPASKEEGDAVIPLIERVMVLKGSELFRYFPGSDLAGIAALAEIVHAEPEEIIFRQGEEGDAFFVVVQGAVRISRGSHELAVLGPREGFGEMAILDRETRSATASAAEPTTLLRIDRDSFDRLVEQNPAVARGIYRVLTERLRNTLAQIASG